MGVREAGGDRDFAEEACGPERSGDLGAEHLERHLALLLQIAGDKHNRCPTAPELVVYSVAISQRRANAVNQVDRPLPCSPRSNIVEGPGLRQGFSIKSPRGLGVNACQG
jgi:hypothetical protein